MNQPDYCQSLAFQFTRDWCDLEAGGYTLPRRVVVYGSDLQLANRVAVELRRLFSTLARNPNAIRVETAVGLPTRHDDAYLIDLNYFRIRDSSQTFTKVNNV